ncbi:MAG: hypothetical protein ACLVJ6_08820 [Merdibacter sp.]
MAAWGVRRCAPLQATHQTTDAASRCIAGQSAVSADGGLRGSISALERYRLCPFSIFSLACA